MTRGLAEGLSEWERSVAEKRHTKDAVAVKIRLAEQVEQLSVCVTELKGDDVVNSKETVADLNFKLKGAEKRAEYVVHK